MFNDIKIWFLNRKLNQYIDAMPTGIRLKFIAIVSLLSVITGAASLLLDGNPATNPDWTATIAALTAAWGLLVARQNNVSSEDVGIKK